MQESSTTCELRAVKCNSQTFACQSGESHLKASCSYNILFRVRACCMCRVCRASAGGIRATGGGRRADRDPGLGTLPQHSHRNRRHECGLELGQRIGRGIRDCWPAPGAGVAQVCQLAQQDTLMQGPCFRCKPELLHERSG